MIEGISSLLFLVKRSGKIADHVGVPGFASKPPPLPLYRTVPEKGLGPVRIAGRFALKNRINTESLQSVTSTVQGAR
jgi:hypothetical protein